MGSVNRKLTRWTDSVREYLFESRGHHDAKAWTPSVFRERIAHVIDAPLGEMDARKRAAQIGSAYLALGPEGRKAVLRSLVEDFGPVRQRIDDCLRALEAARGGDGDEQLTAADLREALKPRRTDLLTRFTSLADGFKFLVDMRQDLLAYQREDPGLKPLDRDLLALFRLWFDQGFLDIERVTWSSSASLLEKLMEYEAIHSIVSWEDLKNRLDRDRRCYTLFHPRMPQEPLAILHVALTHGITRNVQSLLDVDTPQLNADDADTAVFYSVTSPQRGLRGISFGEFIIKEAVKLLRAELPNLETFVTLSPIPGFRAWLDKNLTAEDLAQLPFSPASVSGALEQVARGDNPPWRGELDRLMQRKCLQYLITLDRGRPLNPVTRFHLRNGAAIHRINFMGDTSANGLKSAAGMMVNYSYNLKTLESNLVKYHGGELPVSGKLLKAARADKLDTDHLVASG